MTAQGSGYYQPKPREPKPPKKDHSTTIAGSIGMVIMMTMIVFAVAYSCDNGEGDEGSTQSESVDKWDAQAMCKQFVEDALKAPTSAEFSGETAYGSGTSWTSTGTVDAQNSFGALIRSDYRCEMRYEPATDMWHLESLSGLG